MEEHNIAEILRFLQSMETPDLSKVGEFLRARGVPAEKMRLAQEMLEQMGIRYDSQPEELPDEGELMGLFNQLSPRLDGQTRQQFANLIGKNRQPAGSLKSSEDVLDFLKNMKKD